MQRQNAAAQRAVVLLPRAVPALPAAGLGQRLDGQEARADVALRALLLRPA